MASLGDVNMNEKAFLSRENYCPPLKYHQKKTLPIRTRKTGFTAKFSDAPIKGFVGWIEYSLKRLPPQLRQLIMILSYFGQFSGVGYKTTINIGKIKVMPQIIP